MNAPKTNGHAHQELRVEDDQLVRGLGRFADDNVDMPGRLFGFFIRSPHAFARIKAIDSTEARTIPGVIAVLTAADMKAAGTGTVLKHFPMAGRGGAKLVDEAAKDGSRVVTGSIGCWPTGTCALGTVSACGTLSGRGMAGMVVSSEPGSGSWPPGSTVPLWDTA